MPAFLLFTLHGPMAAWGEIAVGVRRGSYDRPSKSGVLGLVAAALGIDRTAADRHEALHAGYGFAVRIDAPGRPIRDYHTAQSPKSRRGAHWETRRDELAADPVYTVLSVRDYYSDALYTVALWRREEAPHPLDALAEALRRPRFTLYLGRKSCPPALPLAPALVEAETLDAALAGHPPVPAALGTGRSGRALARHVSAARQVRLCFDLDAPGASAPQQTVVRRDALAHRPRWQFVERAEGETWVTRP